jgi:exonuclease III
MRLLSWNVAAREGKLAQQLSNVLEEEPDVVALQEVSTGTHARWRQGLVEAGYSVLASDDLLALPYPPPEAGYPFRQRTPKQVIRTKFNLTASRLPVEPLAGLSFPDKEEERFAFPEKYLAAEVVEQSVAVEVHNAHAPPGSSRGVVKPQAFRAIRRRVDQQQGGPQVLCGDFNTPIREDDDDDVPAGQRHPGLQPEWGEAERGVLSNPRLVDAYRKTRKRGSPFAVSHRTRTRDCRYDHIYVTGQFDVTSCRYLTDWLDEKLSDHAPVVADLSLPPLDS